MVRSCEGATGVRGARWRSGSALLASHHDGRASERADADVQRFLDLVDWAEAAKQHDRTVGDGYNAEECLRQRSKRHLRRQD